MAFAFTALRKLVLGVLLIAAAAGVLLYSDLGSRHGGASRSAKPGAVLRVAIVQHASQSILDEGLRGVLEEMKVRGYADGGRLQIRRYNAEGDVPTANAIAKEVVNGGYDLLLTISTMSMQTVANANRFAGKTRHVFGLVSDPFSAGVGISRENHLEHPPYMTGYGSLQPIENAFRLARDMRPELKSVGLVWNPTESNSVAQTNLARAACKTLGINLLEANAENSASVGEAASSLVSRGAEAMMITGDVTILVAAESVINVARRARIPVFSVIPLNAEKGALFDLGADYVALGHAIGDLVSDVLDGKDPATIPVENVAPPILIVNRTALDGLKDRWRIPDAIAAKADVVIDATGRHAKTKVVEARPLPRTMHVDLIEYVDTPNVETTRQGFLAGLAQAGLKEGRDFTLRRRNAQGDMTTLSGLVDAALTDRTDVIVTSATPPLQAALRRGRGTKTVFMIVANPIVAGAGKSDTDHLFVTRTRYIYNVPKAAEFGITIPADLLAKADEVIR